MSHEDDFRLKNIKQRADKVNKEALELEKAVDVAAKTVHAAEKKVQELQAQLNPKRARIETDVQEEDEIENVGDWTLPDPRRETSRVKKRQDDVLGSRDTTVNYRTGIMGCLQHPRWLQPSGIDPSSA
jgi:small-conductance mechanosensitive channel